MRVLMLSWEYPPNVVGGLGKHVAELVPALARQNVKVHVVTPLCGGRKKEMAAGTTSHRIASRTSVLPDFHALARQTNRALQRASEQIIAGEGPFDLIQCHDWLTSFAAIQSKLKCKLPLLATIHATERGRGRGHLHSEQSHRIDAAEWQLAYEASRVVCCTHYMANEINNYFSAPMDKIDVIPNGVDPAPFQALEGIDLTHFRQQYASPEEKIVLYVGRIVQEKGVEALVRSVPRVLAAVPQTRFVIAGKGPELPRLRQLSHELGVTERVVMPGFISNEERNRLFKVADCAIFPSLYEPFGIVALEAMAARTPVVVSEVGGLREVVRHAETGITIYPNNAESCAWGITHTLLHPQWGQQRAENAYREVLTVYNWDTIAERTLQVYERIVGERARTEW